MGKEPEKLTCCDVMVKAQTKDADVKWREEGRDGAAAGWWMGGDLLRLYFCPWCGLRVTDGIWTELKFQRHRDLTELGFAATRAQCMEFVELEHELRAYENA